MEARDPIVERRQVPRFRTRITATYRVLYGRFQVEMTRIEHGTAIEISRLGARLEVPSLTVDGVHVQYSFGDPSEPPHHLEVFLEPAARKRIRALGVVKWYLRQRDGPGYVLGVSFTELAPTDTAALEEFLATLAAERS